MYQLNFHQCTFCYPIIKVWIMMILVLCVSGCTENKASFERKQLFDSDWKFLGDTTIAASKILMMKTGVVLTCHTIGVSKAKLALKIQQVVPEGISLLVSDGTGKHSKLG